jgi:(p)ppGpp synthase/HD superfamily hydrolase
MNLILKAAALAVRAHEGQRRKYNNRPYVTHPARVAGRVGLLPDVTEEMVAAAYLHDVLEDTMVTREEIERETSPQVGYYVDWMTNKSKGLSLPRAERKAMDRKRLAEAPPQVKQIKLLDRIDNLTEMAGANDDFKKVYAQESLLLAETLGPGSLTDELVVLAKELLGGVK